MGHGCHVCGKIKPNEAFSGKGHRRHVCKACVPITKTQEWQDDQVQYEIVAYLHQKNISPKNQKRLAELCASTNATIAAWAQLVLDVSRIKSYKRKRMKLLRDKHPDVCERLLDLGLISPDEWHEFSWD